MVRLALIAAMDAHQQIPVWLLDEPTTAMDENAVSSFARLIEQHAAAGGGVLLTSHLDLPLKQARNIRLGELQGRAAMISIMAAIIRRDLLIGWRGLSDTLAGIGYFAVIIALLPLAIGPDPEILQLIGPAMLWVAALVASLPQMERFFSREAADGSLDLILTPLPLPLVVLA